MPEPTTDTMPDARRLMEELQFLSELCQVVASNTELQPILDWIVQKTTGMLGADEGTIRLTDSATGDPGQTFIRKEKKDGATGSWPREVAMSVMGFLMHRGDVIATADLMNDERFPGLRGRESRVRSLLAVPLRIGNRVTGVLAVTQPAPGRQWTPAETQLLSIVASNSAGVLEQARLRADALEKKRLEEEARRIDRELGLAREIQMNLVPSRPLTAQGWSVSGRVVPARQVGGDSFDYFMIEGGRIGVAIADVSGKGVPASLLMSNVQASLRAFCDGRGPVVDAVRQINASVSRSASPGKFVTFFYAEVDLAAGAMRYVNAGHNFPMVRRRDGTLVDLQSGGLPLGLFEQAEYEQGEIALSPGDALLLYSDGISEAVDLRNQEFGEERLRELWQRQDGRSPDEVIGAVMSDVETFRGAAAQSDDMTVVVLQAPAR
jgi:sigma-B regulation protein RsbU (phosphoserine phosphatase)